MYIDYLKKVYGETEIYLKLKDALDKAEELPFKYLESDLGNLIIDGYDTSSNCNERIINLLTRLGVLYFYDSKIWVHNYATLFKNLTLSVSIKSVLSFYFKYANVSDLNRVKHYISNKNYSKLPLPFEYVEPKVNVNDICFRFLTRGLNPTYNVSYILLALSSDYADFNDLVMATADCVEEFMAVTNGVKDAYTLYYLMLYFDITVDSLDKAVYVPSGDFITISNYDELVNLTESVCV